MNRESLKYSCLFGGGAIRGTAHVGVIKALEELGVETDLYAGSSVGAIVAALRAVGYSVQELADIFLSVNFELFRDISFGFKYKFALSKGDIFLDWVRELIEMKFYGDSYDKGNNPPVKFKDLAKNLIVITTNIKDFSCCEFSSFETPDFEVALAVRISCCMPGLMRAMNIDDKLLVDGDLMKGKPMWSLSKNLSSSTDRILEIRLEGSFSGSDSQPIEYVNGMYSCMTYSETDFIRNIYNDYDLYDYLVVETGDAVVVDFNYPVEKRAMIIDSGYEQTMHYFKSYLPQKKKKLLTIYSELASKLNLIATMFKRNKYANMKNLVADLYILLYNSKNVMDVRVYNLVEDLQKSVYANVKSGLLGRSTCKNKEEIQTIFRELNYLVLTKRKDLSDYLLKFPV